MRSTWILSVLILMAGTSDVVAAGEALTLRVNDSAVRPSGLVAVVLRTYASRPAGQGQLCFRAQNNSAAAGGGEGADVPLESPFSAFEGGEVFSSKNDTVVDFAFDSSGTGPLLIAQFSSPSATINDRDGPLAVLYFRLDPFVAAGASYSLILDVEATFLLDPEEVPIALDVQSGELQVIPVAAPFGLSVSGDRVAAGAVAELAASTKEYEPLRGGQVKFLYDQSLLGGNPEVVIDPRYGAVEFVVENLPGSTRVTFDSVDASLNRVPGDFVGVRLPIATNVEVGTIFPVTFEVNETFLFDELGKSLPLALEGDEIEIVFEPDIFADGFESGDLSAWM